jgi:glycerophosphoryl diester phosphodiesterase
MPSARPTIVGPGRRINGKKLGTEGIGYRIREILDLMRSFGPALPRSISVSGGLIEDRTFLQTQADLLGVPLVRIGGENGAASGAAALVFGPRSVRPSVVQTIRPRKRGRFADRNAWGRALYLLKSEQRRPALSRSLFQERLSERRTLWFAHRGASHLEPENTLAAFETAVAHAADGIEFDIRLTRDGVPVALHDRTVDRTTDGTGALSKLRRKEIPSTIPALAQILESTPDDLLLYIEIKDEEAGFRLWRSAVAAVKRCGDLKRAAFCSFNVPRALRFKKEHPELVVGAILGRSHPRIDPRVPLYPELDLLCFHHSLVNEALISRIRLQTQVSFVWTVDDRKNAGRLIEIGIDAVVTNRIERLNRSCARMRS